MISGSYSSQITILLSHLSLNDAIICKKPNIFCSGCKYTEHNQPKPFYESWKKTAFVFSKPQFQVCTLSCHISLFQIPNILVIALFSLPWKTSHTVRIYEHLRFFFQRLKNATFTSKLMSLLRQHCSTMLPNPSLWARCLV